MSTSPVIIWHNPRCSKSRQTLALLEERGIAPDVVKYLETPPSAEAITNVLAKLGLTPRQLMRTKEEEYKAQNLADADDAALVAAMVATPKLIERPVVIAGDKAALGRPPEAVLEILP
ncbi:arsenate reductase (glutaredoxin) [Ferrimonas balearica]|uniref:arsenate reductase (glutaredoxin) n=1 Tax=Ferrimonas balearica TaxID=44012 RepID=UPI001C99E1CA|nr:arsenate reductase (glutaredoxin) [Ferrimonas balearica]MBY5921073.1 arsenate reductase (glutaredoxin) [Ferrimonas balearica]MBY5996242.1 arsenate reductase (glutaredoxin) [Ferrimonas balearica]